MNRFKDKMMRGIYDDYTRHFDNREFLFNIDGSPSLGNSWRYSFWTGFYGWKVYDREGKKTTGYPAFRAGQDAKLRLFGAK